MKYLKALQSNSCFVLFLMVRCSNINITEKSHIKSGDSRSVANHGGCAYGRCSWQPTRVPSQGGTGIVSYQHIRANWAEVFLTLLSAMSHWQLELGWGGKRYTTDIGKCNRAGLPCLGGPGAKPLSAHQLPGTPHYRLCQSHPHAHPTPSLTEVYLVCKKLHITNVYNVMGLDVIKVINTCIISKNVLVSLLFRVFLVCCSRSTYHKICLFHKMLSVLYV